MFTPFLGEIRMAAFDYAPTGWALCNGQLLTIAENQPLFALIGITYGGDGKTTFALPDLQGRIAFDQGTNIFGDSVVNGVTGGVETVTLTVEEIPAHNHTLAVDSALGNKIGPSLGMWAGSALDQYSSAQPTTPMSPLALKPAGGGEAHDNMPPYLVVNFIIATEGTIPSQT
jgi:microcystin-dependent protein